MGITYWNRVHNVEQDNQTHLGHPEDCDLSRDMEAIGLYLMMMPEKGYFLTQKSHKKTCLEVKLELEPQ